MKSNVKSINVLAASTVLFALMASVEPASPVLAANATPPPHEADTASPQNPASRWLSADQIRADIALAEEVYSRVHPGYDRYASKQTLSAAWSSLKGRAEAQGGMSVGEFYLALQQVLTLIRCDHTKAELPSNLAEYRGKTPVYLPFRWEWVEGRSIVTVPSEGAGLVFGDEIIAVDGRPIREIVSEVEGFIPVDGFTDWARAGGVAQSLEFQGGAVDHFGSLISEPSPKVTLDVVSADGVARQELVERITFDAWRDLNDGSGSAANFSDAVSYEAIGNNAGILTVNTFVNYRNPVDPETVFDPVFEKIAHDGIETLILDLRANGGGSTDASQSLFAHLIRDPAQIKLDMRVRTLDLDGIREHLSTWERGALNPDPRGFTKNDDGTWSIRPGVLVDTRTIQPDELAFKGKLIILTSVSNSSGSTNLSAVLRSQGRAILVGERTGGSAEGGTAGVLFTLNLPESGIKTRVPVFRYFNNVGDFENGLGLSPDVEAVTTVNSLRTKSDPALERALALVADGVDVSGQFSATDLVYDFSVLLGGWTGSLNYLNFSSPGRATIPIAASIESVDETGMRYSIRFPGEEEHNTARTVSFSPASGTIDGAPIIARRIGDDGAVELITEGDGEDNGNAVKVRTTYEISQSRFTIAKDVQPAPDAAFFNRNTYSFARED